MQLLEGQGLLTRIPGHGYYVTRNPVVDKD
jgi:DNA-binding GntR family transcriptional regulator